MASGDLTDKVCVVTGGGSGIGRALAHRFAAAGMRVAIGDIEAAAIESTVAALGGDRDRVVGLQCDVRSIEWMQRLRDETMKRFDGVHLVCLNAGVAPAGNILDTPPDVWDWVLDVNLRGVIHGVHVFGPLLVAQGAGHIVCTASAAGLINTQTMGPYGMTKHAVVGLAAALRGELDPHGVGVSVLCPGLIKTRIFESERNRPDGMEDHSTNNPTLKQYRELLEASGAPPEQVAEVALAHLTMQHLTHGMADAAKSCLRL
jgi:NAD(P)-dependent dehydrogenase (short-subunit alcohol dehydrogenase family)